VIINSKIIRFKHANQVHAILGRTGPRHSLRAELMLVTASARRLGVGLNVAHVPEASLKLIAAYSTMLYASAVPIWR
jgi:hypothetical protein